jgi:hypothetical protein
MLAAKRMPDTVPECALQNFQPNVTARVPAAAVLVGTASPKIVIGDCANDVLGGEHPMTRTQEGPRQAKALPAAAFA